MFGSPQGIESVAHVIQVALTPIFLLSAIASLLGVFSTRLARVADRVEAVSVRMEAAGAEERTRLQRRLLYLRRRSHVLDVAVVLGAVAGGATCAAALLLFVNALSDRTGVGLLFVAFGAALLCTVAALSAFLVEMLMASRGVRENVADKRHPAP